MNSALYSLQRISFLTEMIQIKSTEEQISHHGEMVNEITKRQICIVALQPSPIHQGFTIACSHNCETQMISSVSD